MTENERVLLSIVQSVVCETPFTCECSISDFDDFYHQAKSQDLAHLVGFFLKKSEYQMDKKYVDLFQKEYLQAIYRVVSLKEEIKKIEQVFNEFNVDYVPLKGAFLRSLYPEEWMRVSADIDMLVRPTDIERAQRLLIDELKYSFESDVAHQVALSSPKGFVVELHRSLSLMPCAAKRVLDNAWDYCSPCKESSRLHYMTNEMLYFYQLFNASKDFQKGGCGVRQVLDIWVLNNCFQYDQDERIKLLKEGGLFVFADTIESIAEKWFSKDANATSNDTIDVEEYILSGGAYGQKHNLAARQAKSGSRGKFLISRFFPPYSNMVFGYSILEKVPVLLPFCWIHRLVKGMFTGKIKKAEYELKKTKEDQDESREIGKIFKKVGLL